MGVCECVCIRMCVSWWVWECVWVGLLVSECVWLCECDSEKEQLLWQCPRFFMLVCAELGWDGEGGGRVDFQAVQQSVLRKKGEKMLSCYFLAAKSSGYKRRPGTKRRHHFPLALKQNWNFAASSTTPQPNFKMAIAGKYTFESQDNFGAFLEAMGELAPSHI